MTKKKDYESLLKAPFGLADLDWRVGNTFKGGTKGNLLAYVDARAIMERLDEVFGVAGWDKEISESDKGVTCTLICRTEDGQTFRKADVSEYTQVSPLKGGASGALKRAAANLGIGRYLYDLPSVTVDLDENKRFKGKVVAIPDKYLPENERTGCDEVKIEYRGSYNSSSTVDLSELSEADIEAAMNFVVRDDKYNSGKKMSEVYGKSLKFLANSRDKEQARAARIVAQQKGVAV